MKNKKYIQVILLVLFLAGEICLGRYMNSEPYLYRKNMEQAEKCFAEEKWSEAYQAYYTALEYNAKDEEAEKGMLLSLLEAAKEDGNVENIIREYKNLFSRQNLFMDEVDVSDWYFECADFYLKDDDPMGAVDLLERGMDVFDEEEILRRMREKKKYILDHCQVKSETHYMLIIYGAGDILSKMSYVEYDKEGRETFRVYYDYRDGEPEHWDYKKYDKKGNMIYAEHWYMVEGEKQKTYEEYRTYDENGNPLHDVEYRMPDREVWWERDYAYNGEGYEIYSKYSCYYPSGSIDNEREYWKISDELEKVREYESGGKYRGEYNYYILYGKDENGNQLTIKYDADIYTLEEIQNGSADFMSKILYMYDAKGNLTDIYRNYYYLDDGEIKEADEISTYEYDDKGNVIKEKTYEGIRTSIYYYNDRDILVKKEVYLERNREDGYGDMELESVFIYDETTGNLMKEETAWEVIEYDKLGNLLKRYKGPLGWRSIENLRLEEKRAYKYCYTGN